MICDSLVNIRVLPNFYYSIFWNPILKAPKQLFEEDKKNADNNSNPFSKWIVLVTIQGDRDTLVDDKKTIVFNALETKYEKRNDLAHKQA